MQHARLLRYLARQPAPENCAAQFAAVFWCVAARNLARTPMQCFLCIMIIRLQGRLLASFLSTPSNFLFSSLSLAAIVVFLHRIANLRHSRWNPEYFHVLHRCQCFAAD